MPGERCGQNGAAPAARGVLAARFLDRIGKGIRGAPRDALVADLTPPAMRGTAFGLRQSLDTVGATLGPVLAIGLTSSTTTFAPCSGLRQSPRHLRSPSSSLASRSRGPRKRKSRAPLKIKEIGALGSVYWLVAPGGAVFAMARFSEAFLVIRARDAGLALAWAPTVIAVMSLVFAASAYPAGRLQDRIGGRPLLIFGLAQPSSSASGFGACIWA